MRKDVKFGLTIGGILVVTLVIYVIVLSRGSGVPQHVGITLQQPTDQAPSGTDNSSSGPRDVARADGDATTDSNSNANDSTNSTSTRTPTAASNEPTFNPTTAAPATQPTSTANANAGAGGNSDWDNALNNGLPPALSAPQHTVTPTYDSTARTGVSRSPAVPMIDAAPATQPTRTVATATPYIPPTIDSASPATPAPLYASAAPTTPTATAIDPSAAVPAPTASTPSSTPRTHRVASGESPYSIAQAIYGNGKYYTLILAANPKVDPHHLRIGQVLVIPELRDSDKSPTVSSARATPSAAIDPSSQYTVASGDTLESISRKLYGNAAFVDKLYQLNRPLIGEDENRLKIGWVLKLPQPPSNSGGSGEVRGN